MFDASYDGWNDPHQRARRIGSGPSGRIDTDAVDRTKPTAQFTAVETLTPIFRQLCTVKFSNVRGCVLNCLTDGRVDFFDRPPYLISNVDVANVDAIEFAREFTHRHVTLLANTGNDLCDLIAD